jgi:hypothetical protein
MNVVRYLDSPWEVPLLAGFLPGLQHLSGDG